MAKLKIGRKIQYSINSIDLIKAREEIGWSQQELSEKVPLLGDHQQYIARIESQLLPHKITPQILAQLKETGFEIELYDT